MSTRDNYKKTLRFSDETDEKLGKLADKCGLSKFQFFNLMVEYFYRTKKDPRDVNDELLKNTLVKNHDTYIRFIRAQEEKILIPVKTEIDRMIQSQLKIIDFFNTRVLKANTEQAERQEQYSQKLRETEQVLKIVAEKADTKESLKSKFLYILNTYIKNREAFSFTTSAKEKDDLIQLTRQQIAKL